MRQITKISKSNKLNRHITTLPKKYPNKINTIAINIYDTLLYPKNDMLPFDIHALLLTFDKFGYKPENQDKFIEVIRKHNNSISQYVLIVNILNDPYLSDYNKYIQSKNHCDTLYNVFMRTQYKLLLNPDYYQIDRSLKTTLANIRNQGIVNICGLTKYNWDISALFSHTLEKNNIYINNIYYNTHYSDSNKNKETFNKILQKYDIKIDKCINIGNSIDDMKAGQIMGMYNVCVSGTGNREELYENGADYIIDNIGQISYLVSKMNAFI